MYVIIRQSIVITLFLALILCGAYPLLVTGVGQILFPVQANGSLVVRAGQSIARHHVAGSMTLYCIAGHMRLGGDAPAELRAGDWLFLYPGTPHSVETVADTSLLLTILFDEGGGVAD